MLSNCVVSSYVEIYANIISRHIYKYCYPINKNRPFVILTKIIDPVIKLIYEFVHLHRPNIDLVYVPIKYINDDECFKLCENIISGHITDLLGNNDLQFENLYELTNNILSHYEPDLEFENRGYNLLPQAKLHVQKYFEDIGQDVIDRMIVSERNITRLLKRLMPLYGRMFIHLIIYNLKIICSSNISVDVVSIVAATLMHMYEHNVIWNHDIKTVIKELQLASFPKSESEIMCRNYISKVYDKMIKTNRSGMFIAHNSSSQKVIDFIAMEQYDKDFINRPTKSLYAAFYNILENMEYRTFRKITLKAIQNENIIFVKSDDIFFDEIYPLNYMVIDRNDIDKLLLYYILKNIALTDAYRLNILNYSAYIDVMEKLIENDKDLKNILTKEMSFIREHFGYNDKDKDLSPKYSSSKDLTGDILIICDTHKYNNGKS